MNNNIDLLFKKLRTQRFHITATTSFSLVIILVPVLEIIWRRESLLKKFICCPDSEYIWKNMRKEKSADKHGLTLYHTTVICWFWYRKKLTTLLPFFFLSSLTSICNPLGYDRPNVFLLKIASFQCMWKSLWAIPSAADTDADIVELQSI